MPQRRRYDTGAPHDLERRTHNKLSVEDDETEAHRENIVAAPAPKEVADAL